MFKKLFGANRIGTCLVWDTESLGQNILVVLCAGSTLLLTSRRHQYFSGVVAISQPPTIWKTIWDVTRLPPGHAFGGLLGAWH